jgi:prevent-host-death family protein
MDISDVHSYHWGMKQIAAARFKQQCLALIDQVDADGLVITKRGRPVAKLIPIATESAGLIGVLKDKVEIKGDLLSTGLGWHAES